ncbi:WhiB family transcriptional regulator [Demequina oxidasica]|uniref:WhiB family transcriptional regulator n=1 Tax=Demequina oxidasica TaxID=676199 RepID=UPI0034E1E896
MPKPMPPALVADWRSLNALIESTHERQPVPCRSGDVLPPSFWTSDDPAEATLAAEECARCPVKEPCQRYGIAHPKEVGIYGGLNEAQRRQVSRETSTEAIAS